MWSLLLSPTWRFEQIIETKSVFMDAAFKTARTSFWYYIKIFCYRYETIWHLSSSKPEGQNIHVGIELWDKCQIITITLFNLMTPHWHLFSPSYKIQYSKYNFHYNMIYSVIFKIRVNLLIKFKGKDIILGISKGLLILLFLTFK